MKKVSLIALVLCLGSPVFGQFEIGTGAGANIYAREVGVDSHFALSVAPAQFLSWDWLSGIYVGGDAGYGYVQNASGNSSYFSVALKPSLQIPLPLPEGLILKGGSYIGYSYGQAKGVGTTITLTKPAFYFEPFGEIQYWFIPNLGLSAAAGYKSQASGVSWERSMTFGVSALVAFPKGRFGTASSSSATAPAVIQPAASSTPAVTPTSATTTAVTPAAEDPMVTAAKAAALAREKKKQQQAAAAAAAANPAPAATEAKPADQPAAATPVPTTEAPKPADPAATTPTN